MKLPSTTKPTSGFHICDILELNKEKHQKKQQETTKNDEEEKSKVDENCDNDGNEDLELKRENLSCESDESVTKNESIVKRKLSQSPTSPIERNSQSPHETSEDIKDLRKSRKSQRQADDERESIETSAGHHHLLNETIHQYPHLFQNHPAMRPWFNSNGKNRKSISRLRHQHETRKSLKSGSILTNFTG